jgi:Flp pilus assembly protein TadG
VRTAIATIAHGCRRAGRRGGALRERGQAMVEFSLVLTLMLVLIFGLIDFGRAYICYVEVTNAAREGARLGATGATTSAIVAKVQDAAGPFNDANLTVPNPNYLSSPGLDSQIQVSASYSLSFITPISALVHLMTGGSLSTGPFTISSTSTMHME